MKQPVIRARELMKRYGSVEAVTGISFDVHAPRVTGFLGRNGAGKSTTIKMLLGMVKPTSGRGEILCHAVDDPRESVKLRRRIAYIGEDKGLYAYLTVAELIRFTRSFYDDWRPDEERRLLREYTEARLLLADAERSVDGMHDGGTGFSLWFQYLWAPRQLLFGTLLHQRRNYRGPAWRPDLRVGGPEEGADRRAHGGSQM